MTDQELAVRNKQEVTREESTRSGRTYVPDVDIVETSDALHLYADMPGVDENKIDIHLADGVLTIEGQIGVGEYDQLTPIYTEYRVGNYLRRFTLSRDVDAERIRARMANGVLEVDLPKTESAKPRKIQVQTA
jgi:HSP20 family protein